MKFKKITAIAGSVLMTGLTVASAAAAAFPMPFVDNGNANVAIVYGADADLVAANSVHSALGKFVTSTGATTVTGGESFLLEKTSNSFNFNDALNAIYSGLDNEDMDFLADGTYDDGDIDEDYEQDITLSSTESLSLFADNDYNDDEPTVGFRWTNGENILSYVITYDEAINFSEMDDTDLPLLGGEYYVLDASTLGTLELLDSAEKAVLTEGETITLDGRSVSIEFIDTDEVKFNVDGELTDKLLENVAYELDDESWIVATEVLYSDKETGISKVEFSIGAGKMTLKSGSEVEINDEDVDGLTATFDSASTDQLTTITLAWDSDDETFLTEGESIMMPGFGAISLIYGGLDYPSESEMISVDNGDTLTVTMENYDLGLMWTNSTATYLGEEDYLLILAPAVNSTSYNQSTFANNSVSGMEVTEDNRFLVTSLDTDLSDVETAYYEVTNIDYTDNTDFLVDLKDLIGDNDLEFDSLEDRDRGDVNIELLGVSETNAYFNFTTIGTLGFNKAISEKGMVITLPTTVDIDDYTKSINLTFTEADKDDDLEQGATFNATVKRTSNDKLHVSAITISDEEGATDKFEGVVPSDLATKTLRDEVGDEYDFEIEYFGKEVTADVQVATGAIISTAKTATDFLPVMASEINSVKDKNLIIIGGSCVNAAAATALGGAYCGNEFTSMTGVSSGQFLIEEMMDKFSTGKTALIVAGYEAADTKNAVTYLTKMDDVDTSEKMVMGIESIQGLA